jgi:signal transduction histidine kinase
MTAGHETRDGEVLVTAGEGTKAHSSPSGSGIMEDAWLDRAKAFAGRFSVRTKIVGIVLILTAILGLGITWQVRSAMSGLAESELTIRARAAALELADHVSDPVEQRDSLAVSEVLDDVLASHPDTVFAVVSRPDGVVVGTAVDPGELPVEELAEVLASPDARPSGYHTFSAPIAGDRGSVTVGMTDFRLVRTVNGVTLQLLVTTLFVGTIGIMAATLLTWLLTRPILDLVRTTHLVSHGDLTARATVTADDEIGTLGQAFNLMVDELETSRRTIIETDHARTRLLEQLIGAQEDERKRIARELHDSVGQSLSSIMLAASMIERSGDPEQAVEIRETASETLTQVRRLGRELRPSVLDDLGLAAALDRYTAEFRLRHAEIATEFHSELAERVPPVVETTIYRVTQEAMTNVARHSGARTLSVLITQRGDTVRAIIEDDGSGFDPLTERRNAHSVGIHGMIERVELLGGRLDIESSDAGTTIYAVVPIAVTGTRS